MSEYDVDVRVTPREGLLDPQGKAIAGALHSLGFEDLDSARVGRLIRLRLRAADEDAARERVDDMCRRLLANPVTEDYTIEVVGSPSRAAAGAG